MNGLQRLFSNCSELEQMHPLDAIERAYPGTGSLFYLKREGLLEDPQFLDFVMNWRSREHEANFQIMQEMTRRYEIDTQLKQHETYCDTQRGINRDSENGATDRTRLSEDGLTDRVRMGENGATDRTRIEADSMLAMQKVKYETNMRIMEIYANQQNHASDNETRMQIHISDNEFRALAVEAEAIKQSTIFTEQMRSQTAMSLSRDQLTAMVYAAEERYAEKIVEAETLRLRDQSESYRAVSLSYIQTQSVLFRNMINLEAERAKIAADIEREKIRSGKELGIRDRDTLEKIIGVVVPGLVKSDKAGIIINYKASSGYEVKLDVRSIK